MILHASAYEYATIVPLSLSLYIYIYVFIYTEMIDCGESDNMIEICGMLDTGLEARYIVLQISCL